MSRLSPAPVRGLLRRLVFRETRRRYDRDLEPLGVMAHHSAVLAGVSAMEMAVERSRRVDPQLKRLAAAKAALVVGCEFCIDIGAFNATASGVSDEQLLALPDHRAASCFDARERAVLDYAEAITRTPVEVTDEIFARVREHLDDRQLVELTNEIAWENWRARFNWAFAIGSAGFTEGQACPIPAARRAPAPIEPAPEPD